MCAADRLGSEDVKMRRRLGIMICSLLLSGCACTDLDHMATTNWMDRTIVPDNRAAQWAMTPVLVPICVGTLAVDNFAVAPTVHAPSGYADARDWFTKEIGGYYTEMGVLPIRVALTPVVFLSSELFRTVFAAKPEPNVRWAWPRWGIPWVRNEDGKLLGSSTQFDPVTKMPIAKTGLSASEAQEP